MGVALWPGMAYTRWLVSTALEMTVLFKRCREQFAGICVKERRCTLVAIEQAWQLTDLDYAGNAT